MSGLLPLLKLIVDSGAVSPKAPTFFDKFRDTSKKPKGRIATEGPAFGELGLKKFF
jgi:hypothetical protein